MFHLLTLQFLCAVLLVLGTNAANNLVLNGGFEQVDVPHRTADHWTHLRTGASVGQNLPGAEGSWAIAFVWYSCGIEQKTTRPVTPGKPYHLSFLYGVPTIQGLPWPGQFGCNLTVSLGGDSEFLSYKEGLETTEFEMDLVPTELESDGKATLAFNSICDGYQGAVLDSVVLTEAD